MIRKSLSSNETIGLMESKLAYGHSTLTSKDAKATIYHPRE